MKKIFSFIAILLIVFILYLLFIFIKILWMDLNSLSPTEQALQRKIAKENHAFKNLHFDLVDPNQAPKAIQKAVKNGFQIMLHTHELLPDYAHNQLNCSNCHFAGGITTGGVNGGISLAGVAAKYPLYNSKTQKIEDLAMRINSCFRHSLNGRPLPLESQPLLELVIYLHWISTHYPIYSPAPWLGLKPLLSDHQPDVHNGKITYQNLCAACHGADGQGDNTNKDHPGLAIPPLWGNHSFNKQAGMNQSEIFSSFIYHNMPYEQPTLTPEQALDITAYVLSQTRP